MPKEKSQKKGSQLRHAPLGTDIENTGKQIKAPRKQPKQTAEDDEEVVVPQILGSQIFNQARDQRMEATLPSSDMSKLNDDSDFDVLELSYRGNFV